MSDFANETRAVDAIVVLSKSLSLEARQELLRRLGVIATKMTKQSFRPSGYRLGVVISDAAREAVTLEVARVGKVAAAERLGVSRAVLDMALLRGTARSDTAEAFERLLEARPATGSDGGADQCGVDLEKASSETWELAEARASAIGLSGRAAIVAAAGSNDPSVILAWALRPLDVLGQ